MSRGYPIWHKIEACHYKLDKSYGSKNNSVDNMYIGSSKSNSHHFAKVKTTRSITKDTIIFRISVDDIVLKEVIFENNKGKAGKKLKSRNKLKSLKSL